MAVGNWESSKEIIVLFFNWWGVNVLITKEVVKVAVGNLWRSKEVINFFLD